LAAITGLSACALDRSGLFIDDAGPFGPDAPIIDAGPLDDAGPIIDAGPLDDAGPPPDDAGPPPTDGGPACSGWAPRHFRPCEIGGPEPELVISINGTYNTNTGTLTDGDGSHGLPGTVIDQAGTSARVLSVQGFRINSGARLVVVGAMPLIVASWTDITIEGELDASSLLGGRSGAGWSSGSCGDGARGEDGASGTGGGGGGGFGGRGGNGGQGDGNGTERNGGAGGAALGAPPAIVRGGCAGADSGAHTDTSRPYSARVGTGGAGGGAVQLTARDRVQVSGRMLAGGAGGMGGFMSSAAGGGGGGSGGYIGLEGAQVVVTGVLAANGGGGGEGCILSTAGANGANGGPDRTRATGGDGPGTGATGGGAGGAGSTLAGADVPGIENGGGGGGGGGAGFVLIWSVDYTGSSAVISPDAIITP